MGSVRRDLHKVQKKYKRASTNPETRVLVFSYNKARKANLAGRYHKPWVGCKIGKEESYLKLGAFGAAGSTLIYKWGIDAAGLTFSQS